MSLRIYHFEEQAARDDVDAAHRAKVDERLSPLPRAARRPVAVARRTAGRHLQAGRKLLKVYRQMKMYNDPTLNPYLYRPRLSA